MSNQPIVQQVRLESLQIYRRLVIYIDRSIPWFTRQLSRTRRPIRGVDILRLSIRRIADDRGLPYVRLSTCYIWMHLLNENQRRIYTEISRSVNNFRLLTPQRPRRILARTTSLERIQATIRRNSFLAEPPQNNLVQDQDEREVLNSDLLNGSQFCSFNSSPH